MKKLLLVSALFLSAFALRAQPAECVYCQSWPCYGPCNDGCVCITGPGELSGSCYGFEQSISVLKHGGRILK